VGCEFREKEIKGEKDASGKREIIQRHMYTSFMIKQKNSSSSP